MPPGQYRGYLFVASEQAGSVAGSLSSAMEVRAVLYLPGERLGEIAGSGGRCVTLPGGRTCSDGAVPAVVPAMAQRVYDVWKVELFVGYQRFHRVTEPKEGKAVSLRAPLYEDVIVRAEVSLDHGKVKVVGACYVACGT